MTSIAILNEVNLLFGGLLAGAEIAIHYGFGDSDLVLSEESQIRIRQAMILRLRIMMPILFFPTAVTGILIALLDGVSAGFWLRCTGMLAAAVWILVRVVATVRINSATLTWNAKKPPVHWKALVHRAERFHALGVWAAIVLFACFLTAAFLCLEPFRGG